MVMKNALQSPIKYDQKIHIVGTAPWYFSNFLHQVGGTLYTLQSDLSVTLFIHSHITPKKQKHSHRHSILHSQPRFQYNWEFSLTHTKEFLQPGITFPNRIREMTSLHQATELELGTTDSVASSPRGDDPHTRVRFMCSFGGKILPRPHDNQLRYVGGDTRIVAVHRATNYSTLLTRLSKLSGTYLHKPLLNSTVF